MTTLSDPDDVWLAGEYVLRLVDDPALADLHQRARNDPDFAKLVHEWQEKFEDLNDGYEEVAPHPSTKAVLMGRLFGTEEQTSLWSRLGFWRFVTAVLFAVSVGLSAVLLSDRAPTASPVFVAEMASEDQQLRVLALYDQSSGQVRIARSVGAPAADRSFQLWGIAPDANPVSIGVLPATSDAVFDLPSDLASSLDGLVLAISDEPTGGSPTGQPTGAVLAVGELQEM